MLTTVNLWAEARSNQTSARSAQRENLVGSGISLFTLSFTMVAVFVESVRRLSQATSHGVVVDSSLMLLFGTVLCCFHLTCLYAYYFGGISVHSHGHSHAGNHGDHESCGSPGGHSHVDNSQGLIGGHGHSHDCCGVTSDSLNMASAVFHILIDFLHSFFVVMTGLLLHVLPSGSISGTIDAIASLILSFLIGGGVWILGREFISQLRVYNKSSQSHSRVIDSGEESEQVDDGDDADDEPSSATCIGFQENELTHVQ